MDELIRRLSESRWTAGVIGLGYVGLPLAVTAVAAGLDVVGFDVSPDRADALMAGTSHVEDVAHDTLRSAVDQGAEFTSDASLLAKADCVFICVPSPLGRNRQPDMSFIEAAAATVSSIVRPGQLIALESTTYPGTTEEILVPAVTAAGLTVDEDVFIAFSPERVSPGGAMKTSDIPKVVGGVSEKSTAVAAAAYSRLVASVYPVSSARTAEMAKLLENTYRAVNIGLINEMAQLSHELDIDIWEVIDAAATKPFGFQPFYPGPGVGGHCIPLDPQFLAWRAREANFTTRFIDTAEQVNSKMPAYTADRVADALNRAGKPVFGSRILGVGVAYKPNIGDDRESAALQVLDLLADRGAAITVFDPLVNHERHDYPTTPDLETAADFDLAIILTDHDAIDYQQLIASRVLVFDTRNALARRGLQSPSVEVL